MSAASLNLSSYVDASAEARVAPKRGLLAGLIHRFHEARLRKAELEIARFIERRGARITDDLERRIERHFG